MKDPDSEITYKAPAGTERIIIKYTGLFSKADADGVIQAKLYVDGAALTSLNPGFFDGYHRDRGKYAQLGPMTFTAIVTSQHINLQVSHTYHFQVMSVDTSTEINIWRDPVPAADWMWPQLEIKAIGRQVAPASAADFKIQRVNTMSSEPDNGSVLLYDSGKKEWTASGTRMEDQDIRLLSNPNVYPDYEMLASSTYYSTDSTPEWYQAEAAFHLNHGTNQ